MAVKSTRIGGRIITERARMNKLPVFRVCRAPLESLKLPPFLRLPGTGIILLVYGTVLCVSSSKLANGNVRGVFPRPAWKGGCTPPELYSVV